MDYPPKQYLLPETMNEIFNMYIKFRDPYEYNFPWISHSYNFPEMEGLAADGVIKKWICQYIAVLYLRQYTIIPYLITMKPLEKPKIPSSQTLKKQWIDNLDFFESLIKKAYSNESQKSHFGFEYLNNKWCLDNNTTNPIDLIIEIKKDLSDLFEETKIKQVVSDKKTRFIPKNI